MDVIREIIDFVEVGKYKILNWKIKGTMNGIVQNCC